MGCAALLHMCKGTDAAALAGRKSREIGLFQR